MLLGLMILILFLEDRRRDKEFSDYRKLTVKPQIKAQQEALNYQRKLFQENQLNKG